MLPDEQLPGKVSDPIQAGQSDQGFPVVGVGASAGGLEAFTELLRHLPADTGMAFVFIQHLAPRHESMLAHLLSRETAMCVNEVADGAVLSPNQVYVIPPNAAMTISGLTLFLKPRETAGTAIDGFLRSLAAGQKSRAIAVILSGTGSDGALGVQAIAEEGGVVFVQDTSAKFDGMPRSAIATGCVDFVLPPEAIGAELVRIAGEPRLIRHDITEPAAQSLESEKDFQSVLELLRASTGIDFSLYRQTTVRRRLVRRLALLRQRSLCDYVQHVKENPDEAHALAQDILIRVTRFFRDPEVFDVLSRRVFPALIRKRHLDHPVRIWVPGCSTGEEAYSIAICFLEVAEQMRSRVPLQLFATDINDAAVEKARRGVYIENIAADVSPERLARFFVRTGKDFQIARKVRDLCIFSRHDLLNDPPFSRMDLVSCRNVLIYLDAAQERALARFHFTLNPGGFLLLGRSETATSAPELFAPLDKDARLYGRQESAKQAAAIRADRKTVARPHPRQELVSLKGESARRLDLRRQADHILVDRYGPAWIIVNGSLETVMYSGETAAFRAAAFGTKTKRILELLKEDDAEALRNATRAAAKTGQSVRIDQVNFGDVGKGSSPAEIDLEVAPLGPERQHYLIAFEERTEPDLEPGAPLTEQDRRKFQARISRLEKELASSRAHLESIAVEQEAAHEEVVASNEELQSLNEELESSAEELEAANEELTTLNQELRVRNTELENTREFADATIDTVRGALLVLGPDLRVLRANKSFYRMFRLSPPEVEQYFIYELSGGGWRLSRLRDLLEKILPESLVSEDFEMEHEQPSLGRRVLLLNARRFEHEDRILLAIEDVTESRRVEQELRQSQKMEAVGYLAAGVAHDFNNLLTGIMGNASLVLDGLPEDSPGRRAIESVVGGAQRAADLTRQLLAYAGKGRFFAERVNLSELIIQTGRLIHPSIPSNVQLRLDLDMHLPSLLADPGQIQQVVMNLLINGAEAIGKAGGMIQVRTARQDVSDEPLPDLFFKEKVTPGEYVFLEVLDNGSGIDERTMRKIFDPFFSTKFTGRGLGLAAVLGIVRQHKGAIQVSSAPGRGSSFRVLFPVGENVSCRDVGEVSNADLRGAGTVLVVDDEEIITNFGRSALEPYGYSVLLARDGPEAIRIFQEQSADIGLVLLDVALPGMDGLETLERIREIRPDIRIIVCSGIGDQAVETRFKGKDIIGFFPKPYTAKQLASKVKECMPPRGAAD